MKKLVSMFVLTGLVSGVAVAAPSVPSHIKKNENGGYDVTYSYKDKVKSGWYATARAELSFLNWKNKYSSNDPSVDEEFSEDKYSFEPVFGGSLAAGRHFGYFWRGEVELGYIGNFTDNDNGFNFELSVPYATANAYYDFLNGLYVGGGLGVAIPTTRLDWEYFDSGSRTKTTVSPMLGLMAGYAKKLDDNLMFDLRYRLAGLMGTKHKRGYIDDTDTRYEIQNKIGLILDNSVSIGLRYEF